MLVDVHSHLTDGAFFDRESIIKNFEKDNVAFALVAGDSVSSSKEAVELAEKYERIYACVGIHPESAADFSSVALMEIRKLATQNKVVAIGEIGLDYYWKPYDEEAQKRAFLSQMELAKELSLPIVIHQRNVGFDVLDILKTERNGLKNVILHCFSESTEMLKEFEKLDCYFSFGGTLTFKNANKTVEALKICPLDKVLTETDSPYLSPQTVRGQRNEPKNVQFVIEKIAELKGLSVEKTEETVLQNAKTAFSI